MLGLIHLPRKWLESGANPHEISHAFPDVLGTGYVGNARWQNSLQRAIEVSAEASQYLSMVYIVAVTDSPHFRPFPFSPTGVWSIGRQFSDKDRTRVGNTLIDQGLSHSLPYHINRPEACYLGSRDVVP